MKATIKGFHDHGCDYYSCVVQLEAGDPKYCGRAGESRLWYHIRNALTKAGFPVKKIRPHGLTSAPYVLESRQGEFFVYQPDYAIRLLQHEFDQHGALELPVCWASEVAT